MIDKKLRRASWPGIAAALRRGSDVAVDQYNKTNSRRYYVDGIEFSELRYKQQVHVHGLSYFARLILEPDAPQEKWREWCANSTVDVGEFDGGVFLEVQRMYFGENTVFQGREAEIYEYFYARCKGARFPVSDEDPVKILLNLPNCVTSVLGQMKLNPYYLSWRFAERRFEELRELPVTRFDRFDRSTETQLLAQSMCAIEWAYLHPDLFDPLLKPIVESCRDFYINSNSAIRRVYEQTLEDKLDSWSEATGAGGKMNVAIEFDAPEYLQAVLPLLDATTRYPCKADDPPGLVRALPALKGRSYRNSYYLIDSLWEAGFVVDELKLVGDTTLLLEVTLPLSRKNLFCVLVFLVTDATNLEERIEARSNLPGDTRFEDEIAVANLVYLMQPRVGKQRVGAIRRVDEDRESELPAFSELLKGSSESIDKILIEYAEEEQMVALLDQYRYILEKGTKPMHTTIDESIDGFRQGGT